MFVYFVKTKAHPQMLKIGKACDVQRRIAELQTGCPYDLELLGLIRCKSQLHAIGVEKKLHRIFKHLRTRGEWFHCGRRTHLAVQAVLSASCTETLQEAASKAFAEDTERVRRNKPQRQHEERGRDFNREMDREFAAIVG